MKTLCFIIDGAAITSKEVANSLAEAFDKLSTRDNDGLQIPVAFATKSATQLHLAKSLNEYLLIWHKDACESSQLASPLSPVFEVNFTARPAVNNQGCLYEYGGKWMRFSFASGRLCGETVDAKGFCALQVVEPAVVAEKMRNYFGASKICIISNTTLGHYRTLPVPVFRTSESYTTWFYLHMQRTLLRAKELKPLGLGATTTDAAAGASAPESTGPCTSRRLLDRDITDPKYHVLLKLILKEAEDIAGTIMSNEKVKRIYLAAINKTPLDYAGLRAAIFDPSHSLYQALNHQRGWFTATAILPRAETVTKALERVQRQIEEWEGTVPGARVAAPA